LQQTAHPYYPSEEGNRIKVKIDKRIGITSTFTKAVQSIVTIINYEL